MKKIAIIGAGPAGLMTAAMILEGSKGEYEIVVYEKNPHPGAKLLISGGGRCNITTSYSDRTILSHKYTRGWDFIKKSLGSFSPKHCFDWFQAHGLPLKIENDGRVFPQSDDGHDVLGVFEDIFAKYRDRIRFSYRSKIEALNKYSEQYMLKVSGREEVYDIIVLATGGNAYAHTGSSGDGYTFARDLGHTITPLGPSLSSFLTSEVWLHALSGLSFPDARIGDLRGALLLTHFGISGPLAFMYSSNIAWEHLSSKESRVIHFSPIASRKKEDWDILFRDEFQKHPKKMIIPFLSEYLPRRFTEAFILEYFPHIQTTYLGSIGKKDREQLSSLLGEGIPVTLTERRPGDEFVTAGGVSTDEIDPITMESKIRKNLYFVGEILNVDGYTGGYSLQICWSSGAAAGRAIVSKKED